MTDSNRASGDELLRHAHKLLKLKDVYLRSINSEMDDEFVPKLAGGLELMLQTKIDCVEVTRFDVPNKGDAGVQSFLDFRVLVGARFLSRSDMGEQTEAVNEKIIQDTKVFEVTGIFGALYSIHNELPPDEVIHEFGSRNATFHVWPYWRELLHSICSRIHVPGTVLPMMTLPPVGRPRKPVRPDKDVKRKGPE